VTENETWVRPLVFCSLFILLTVLEHTVPRRPRMINGTSRRVITNLFLLLIDIVTLRLAALALPLLAIGAAIDSEAKGWGLFNLLSWPWWLEICLSILILDFVIWIQHLVSHKIPVLWRLHQVHHTDQEMDVSTGIRFHPIEIGLSMLLKISAIYLLGPLAIVVVAYEILLNGMALFNHANLGLPAWLDRKLRWLIVTPDMHRVHHSVHRNEHDSNYGNTLSIWDRIFRTYIPEPKEGHQEMDIGLHWRDEKPQKLSWNLLLPFKTRRK
jgi:sterol desaturase/sphingolipid hydroxylase (fatty acid hydroxylase superfamily)